MPESRPLLIGDKWVHTSLRQPVHNPYDGSVIADVCQAGEEEVTEALDRASMAFAATKTLPTHARATALERIATSIGSRKEEFARSISLEAGKPLVDARREVDRAIQTFRIAGEESKRIPGEVIPLDLSPGMENHSGMVRRFPLGPVLGITPFNFPLNLVAHKVAPCC